MNPPYNALLGCCSITVVTIRPLRRLVAPAAGRAILHGTGGNGKRVSAPRVCSAALLSAALPLYAAWRHGLTAGGGYYCRLALLPLGLLAARRLHAGVSLHVAVALADLLRRAVLGLAGQVLRLPAAFLLFIAAHFDLPFASVQAPRFGASSLSISSRHAARVSSLRR